MTCYGDYRRVLIGSCVPTAAALVRVNIDNNNV